MSIILKCNKPLDDAKQGRYSDGYAEWEDGRKVTDRQVAHFVKKHTHWWDRFDYHKICDCAQMAFDMLSGHVEMPKKKNWKF